MMTFIDIDTTWNNQEQLIQRSAIIRLGRNLERRMVTGEPHVWRPWGISAGSGVGHQR